MHDGQIRELVRLVKVDQVVRKAFEASAPDLLGNQGSDARMGAELLDAGANLSEKGCPQTASLIVVVAGGVAELS